MVGSLEAIQPHLFFLKKKPRRGFLVPPATRIRCKSGLVEATKWCISICSTRSRTASIPRSTPGYHCGTYSSATTTRVHLDSFMTSVRGTSWIGRAGFVQQLGLLNTTSDLPGWVISSLGVVASYLLTPKDADKCTISPGQITRSQHK